MARKHFVLAPLFACSLLLVMGALHHQPLFLSSPSDSAFVAQPIAIAAGLENLTPEQLLARAAAQLAPDKVQWLQFKTWQKQVDDQVNFDAEGRLLRGPNRCVRLEMTVHGAGNDSAIVTVSDGVDMAHRLRREGQAPKITTQRFVTADAKPMTEAQIDQILNAHGCAGPQELLKDLLGHLEKWQVHLGTWNHKPVFRLTGSVKEIAVRNDGIVRPHTCQVYLDAQSLWPHRVEWWNSVLVLQLEFRDPEINHSLSHEECVREFTFLPE